MAVTCPARVGIGGWQYAPWRDDNFYPADLPQREELAFASRHVSAIEVNSTYYGPQKPATFARWRDETPEGFVFALKAPRQTTWRRVLSEGGDGVRRFIDGGLSELGDKLGPILWQFPPTKAFEPEDVEGFLALLPERADGRRLRHVLEVRHPGFMDPAFLAMARRHGVATVFTDSDRHPSFADLTTPDLVYLRLVRSRADLATGYAPEALDHWGEAVRVWAGGREPEGLPRIESPLPGAGPKTATRPAAPREVFVFFIDGAKEHAPAAALGLLARLGLPPRSPA
jgi:uncharacterized protein YecE (DUF72 family)